MAPPGRRPGARRGHLRPGPLRDPEPRFRDAGSGVGAVERAAGEAPRPRRWAGSTRASSSTPTRRTSQAPARRAGACCSSRRRAPSTTTSHDIAAMRRRIVEFHRGRDRYLRKHGRRSTRALWTICWTWAYLVRAGPRSCCPAATRGVTSSMRGSSFVPPRARVFARRPTRSTAGEGGGGHLSARPAARAPSTLFAPMEHADTAQLAAVGGAVGSVLVLLARGRGALLAGLILLAAAEVGLAAALGTTGLDKLASASGAAVAVVGIALLAAAPGSRATSGAGTGGRADRRSVSPAARVRQLEPPARVGGRGRAARASAAAVLRARSRRRRACLARASRSEPRPPPRVMALPAAAFFAFAVASLGRRHRGRRQPAAFLHAAVRGAADDRRALAAAGLGTRALAATAILLASLFAVGPGRSSRTSCSSTR